MTEGGGGLGWRSGGRHRPVDDGRERVVCTRCGAEPERAGSLTRGPEATVTGGVVKTV
jgi:hypothetical protein